MKYLITGGNGTFGTAMIERLFKKEDTEEIRIFSRGEKSQWELRNKFPDKRLKCIIGDIREYNVIFEALKGVDICLHAAALKHIDKCEKFPLEAIKTNITGSQNVIFACINNHVKKLVCLSTDKATNAETTYGSTKYIMEKLALGIKGSTDIILTRYGNVIGSNGSVVCLFKEQAKKGLPLTVTNRDMTRFFMTIDEAVDLVEYAIENGKKGDLFVYDNKACTIGDIADLISSNQKNIGLRCSEKTGEALLTITELNHSEKKGVFYRVNNEISNEGHTEPFISDNAKRFTKKELKELLEGI